MGGADKRYLVGTSGWSYGGWRGVFYPPELPSRQWLAYYAQQFGTVELNATFYRLPRKSTFEAWRDSVPPGFLFAVKASQLITHLKRLRDAGEAVSTFLARASLLEEHLGPILYQLPPGLHLEVGLLDSFLAGLPRSFTHVVEFRHMSWYDDRTYDLLRKHGACLCIHDMKGSIAPVVATSSVAYVRFHGTAGRYAGSYSDQQLAEWAARFRGLPAHVTSIYAYFNNDIGGCAVADAHRLARLL